MYANTTSRSLRVDLPLFNIRSDWLRSVPLDLRLTGPYPRRVAMSDVGKGHVPHARLE